MTRNSKYRVKIQQGLVSFGFSPAEAWREAGKGIKSPLFPGEDGEDYAERMEKSRWPLEFFRGYANPTPGVIYQPRPDVAVGFVFSAGKDGIVSRITEEESLEKLIEKQRNQ